MPFLAMSLINKVRHNMVVLKEIIEQPISWEDFKKEIINKNRGKNNILYRGHGNKEYKLECTLSRHFPHSKQYCAHEYLKKMRIIAKNRPNLNEVLKKVPDDFLFIRNFIHPPQPEYEKQAYATFYLMIHLRHARIPSPLLDWTEDPYTAAFFAFNDIKQKTDIAIFVLEKKQNNYASFGTASVRPNLFLINHAELINNYFIDDNSAHSLLKRHLAQKAAYTICYSNHHSYSQRKNVTDITYELMDQSKYITEGSNGYSLQKYIIPLSERKKVLKSLLLEHDKSHKAIYCEDYSYDDLPLEHFYFND